MEGQNRPIVGSEEFQSDIESDGYQMWDFLTN